MLRGLLLVAAGVVVLTNGQLVLTLAVFVVGAWIVYVGSTEVILVVGRKATPEPVASVEAAGTQQPSSGLRTWGVAGLTALLIVVIGVGAVVTNRAASSSASEAGERKCNGHAELCERRLDKVVFAASHNPMSAAEEPNWLYGEHFGGIPAPLAYGIRAFLIDTHYGVPSDLPVPGSDEPLVLTDAGHEIDRAE